MRSDLRRRRRPKDRLVHCGHACSGLAAAAALQPSRPDGDRRRRSRTPRPRLARRPARRTTVVEQPSSTPDGAPARPDGPHLPRPAGRRRRPGRAPGPGRRAGAASARPSTSAAEPRHHADARRAAAERQGTSRPATGHRDSGRRRPRLVVDATAGSRPPRLAGHSAAARRPTAPRAGSRRTSTRRPARCCAASSRSQTVDGSGQSLYSGTVPLQLTQSGSTYQLKDPTRGGTYTTDMNNKARTRSCARSSARAARPGRCSPARTRRSATAPPAAGSRPASTRSTAPT